MARYAMIDKETHVVKNVSEWCGTTNWAPPASQYVVQDDRAGIDDKYDPVAKKFIYIDRTHKD